MQNYILGGSTTRRRWAKHSLFLFQTKAAYVLFYQRRDLTNMMSKTPIVNSSNVCNGQAGINSHQNTNGTGALDQSSEEDMETDQNGK